jgi:hypothetical protein
MFLSCGHFLIKLLLIFKVSGFKSHKYCGSEQVQQQKNAFPRITRTIPLSHCAFATIPGLFSQVNKILGDVTQLKLL